VIEIQGHRRDLVPFDVRQPISERNTILEYNTNRSADFGEVFLLETPAGYSNLNRGD
jgi:hypothetical protein